MAAISLRQIEAFKAVVEHGTVSMAALALRVSQPSLSKLIANLERESGLILFERQKGRLILSDRGRRLYTEIDRIFVGLDQLERSISEIKREESELLRIGIIPALSGRFLQKAVKEYLRMRPGTQISVRIRESQFLGDWIENGKLDVLVASRATDIKGLERISLMKAPVVCILPRGHALGEREVITPELLANENLISLTSDNALPNRIAEVFASCGTTPFGTIEASLITSLCRLVEGGLGVSLVHPLVAADSGTDVTVRRFEPEIVVDFHIYRSATRRPRPYVEDFIGTLQHTGKQMLR